MIAFTPEADGWFWVDFSPDDRKYVGADYDVDGYQLTRCRLFLVQPVLDWIRLFVEPDHWDVVQDSSHALTLYLYGHENAVAFQMRWG
jgi:hypothetical protein